MTTPITDRSGNSYNVNIYAEEYGIIFFVFRMESRVAHLFSSYRRGSREILDLADLKIDDSAPIVESRIKRWLRRVIGSRTPEKDFQRAGLGSALLDVAVKYAMSQGIKGLHGKLTRDDCKRFPGLPQWYEDRGFLYGPSAVGDDPRFVGTIFRSLEQGSLSGHPCSLGDRLE